MASSRIVCSTRWRTSLRRWGEGGRALPLALGALILGWTGAAQERPIPDPPILDSIAIVTHNLFDPAEASRSVPFRLANALHVTTRAYVIRNELLFRTGEPYDSAAVAETLRNLRSRGLFRDVQIDTVRVNGRLVARVHTADGWTTQLVVNARSTGGEFSWALGVQETNLLGTGAIGGVTYRDEPDRTAVNLALGLRRIGGSRLTVSGFYDDLSDGERGVWEVGLPFRATVDRSAFTLSGQAGRLRVLQFRDGDSLDTYRRRLFVQRADLAYAPVAGTGGFLRVGLGAQVRREEHVVWPGRDVTIPDSVSGAVGVFADLFDARFKVVTHYNGFARETDVDLSTRLVLGAWVAPSTFGYSAGGVGPSVAAQAGVAFPGGFARLEAAANGLYTSAGLDSGQVRLAVTAATQVIPKSATVFHLEVGTRRGTPPGAEFDLGHGLGPRAFGPHAFTGDRTVWGSLEHRAFLLDEVLGLLGIGFSAFLDYGGAWYADQPRRTAGNVGLGLRIGATRATGQNIGGFDIAYRFGDLVEGSRWVFLFGRGFSF